VFEIQGEEYFTLYSGVPELHVEGNITVYNDVCLRYRAREMLLCTVMCV